ncbi:DNA (cytosine-5)-methyltransferase 1 [Ereboglobus sp. PH5-5]|uniref:DNA cytosine methyltransferase n=1 Tax=Ereboglobus sp. PH5-5 TaxID=2940529 RepID=UPI002406AE5D|nr:DNA cytosine methyltransferase [Ereboglobus sp. PH5-5]MDF9832407.1 DNA (cytosine-5)-methyltransferase 1 [Ereboglobus sp. PH5-5]
MPIPIIDLFAGPGGLNEGFNHIRDASGEKIFKTVLSIEREHTAHKTLELRALFRYLKDDDKTLDYYRYVHGEILRETLFERHPVIAKLARAEAMHAELGRDNNIIDKKLAAALQKKNSESSDCVIIGGPPCQAYSLIGRSSRIKDPHFEDDEKHYLYKEYLRIVRQVRPVAFIMENVPGLLSAKNKGVRMFQKILDDLGTAGYDLYPISPESKDDTPENIPSLFVVRAEEHGVPQARSRVFILGLRKDLRYSKKSLTKSTTSKMTVREAINDLPKIRSKVSKQTDSPEIWRNIIKGLVKYDFCRPMHLGMGFQLAFLEQIKLLSATLPVGSQPMIKTKENQSHIADWYNDENLKFILNHNSRGHMASDLQRYFFCSQYAHFFKRSPSIKDIPTYLRPDHGNIRGDMREIPFADRFRVQVDSHPSTTVVSHISKDGHYYIHYDPLQCRSLSVREAARLQTFPDNYFFEGAPTDQYRQVGNAVPPYLAMQIARLVYSIIRS